eukprot:7733873-Pyramimonas_sp.AAC.1
MLCSHSNPPGLHPGHQPGHPRSDPSLLPGLLTIPPFSRSSPPLSSSLPSPSAVRHQLCIWRGALPKCRPTWRGSPASWQRTAPRGSRQSRSR